MKKSLILGWLLCIAPIWTIAQGMDTAAVMHRVDSLIQVSRALTGQRAFDKALEANAAAEQLVLEKLGRETAAYGATCFSHGRILYFKGDYPQSEKWYLESIEIRKKTPGKQSLAYAQSLNNLANLY